MDRLPTAGELLRRWRIRARLTQQELADRAGMSVRGLRDLERERVRRPRPASAERLAAALGLSAAERGRLAALLAARPDPTGAAAPTVPPAGDPAGAVTGPSVGVLGPLQLRRDGVPAELRAPMLRLLLGLLAMQPEQVVGPDEIVDVLWGDRPPRSCAGLVRTYVRRLREVLGPAGPDAGAGAGPIVTLTGGAYRLDLDATRLDLARFDALAAQARQLRAAGELDAAADRLAQALRCWRGPALADIRGRLAQHPAVVAVTSRRSAAAVSLSDIAIRLGRYEQAVEALRPAARDEPLDEALQAQLIRALAGAGQRASALRLYADVQARLVEELGVQPGTQVQAAYLAVLREEPAPPAAGSAGAGAASPPGAPGPVAPATPATPADPVAPGPGATPGSPAGGRSTGIAVRPAQLPADVWGFTGRKEYIERLDALLPAETGEHPPVLMISAIAGAAGVGKTALAVRWAHQVRHRFPDGQLFVNLRGYAAGPPVRPVDALARFLPALGVPATDVPADLDDAASLYRSLLAERRMLVLLDNAAAAEQVRPLLPGSPGCLVVVTSRDLLLGLVAADGAVSLNLDVLPADEAFTLLVRLLGPDRAHREPEAVTELAGLCGHLPLALRIAAANLGSRPGTIAGYTAHLAGDRLSTLRVAGDPQAAVRVVFDQSYASLPAPARRLFRLLGLVPGPDVSAGAAAALADLPVPATAELLDQLAGAHLIDEPAPDRYALHDLLRLYAADQAGRQDTDADRQAALDRLFDHYLRRTTTAADLLYPTVVRLPETGAAPPAAAAPGPGAAPAAGPGGDPAPDRFATHAEALRWLDAERPNLVAAVRHAAAHGPYPLAWQLADALRGYLYAGMLVVDWRAVAQLALATADAHGGPQPQAAAHLTLATLHWTQGGYQEAVDHFSRAASLARTAGWVAGEAVTLGNFASLYTETGRLAEAADLYQRALEIKRRTGWLAGQARDLANFSVLRVRQGLLAAAAAHSGEALALYRQTGSRIGEGQALAYLGEAQHLLGRFAEAHATLTEAVDIHREVGDRETESETLAVLAAHHRDAGRYRRALAVCRAALALAQETGDRRAETDGLTVTASIHGILGRPAQAISGLRRAVELARSVGRPYGEADALIGLGGAHRQLGQYDRATGYTDAALAIARRCGYRLLEANGLTTLAMIDIAADHPARGRDHAARALTLYVATGHRLGQAHAHLVAESTLRALGDERAAAEHHRQAHALLTEIGAPARPFAAARADRLARPRHSQGS